MSKPIIDVTARVKQTKEELGFLNEELPVLEFIVTELSKKIKGIDVSEMKLDELRIAEEIIHYRAKIRWIKGNIETKEKWLDGWEKHA
jgi:hypothetical protein